MAEKKYIEGSSVKARMGQYGEFFSISLNFQKLKKYVNEQGYINMTMTERKEVGQYGDTHYLTLNEWKPSGKKQEETTEQLEGETDEEYEERMEKLEAEAEKKEKAKAKAEKTKADKENPASDGISIEDIPF